MKFVAIDFETANYKRQSVCSIGIAVVEDFKIVDTYSKLIKPTPNYYERKNISIHNIRPEMTDNEKTFGEIWSEIKPYIEKNQIVAHNASFDFSALRSVLDSYGLEYPELDYHCTMLLSKKLYPGLLNYQLSTVCKELGIELKNHHDAKNDAVACAELMIRICKDNNFESFDDLSKRLNSSSGKFFLFAYKPFNINAQRKHTPKDLFDIVPESSEFDEDHPFFNKRVIFTGALSISRNEGKQMVVNAGGIVNPDTWNNKTNFLVVGNFDYNQFGEGFESSKIKKARQLIAQGCELEVISEDDFFKMLHPEESEFEITIVQINKDSKDLLDRDKYNDFSGKNIFFSTDLSIDRNKAFQLVGDCSGIGNDSDSDVGEILNTDYFVIANKLIEDLNNEIKRESILEFESYRSKAQNKGNFKSVKLISEDAFLKFRDRRFEHQEGKIRMNIHEWEIK